MASHFVFFLAMLLWQTAALQPRRTKIVHADKLRVDSTRFSETLPIRRPSPLSKAPSGQLLMLSPDANTPIHPRLALSSYSPATGKVHPIATYETYAAGYFMGADVASKRVFIQLVREDEPNSFTFHLATVDIGSGKIMALVNYTEPIIYASTWDAQDNTLVGFLGEFVGSATNFTLARVNPETGNVDDILYQFNSSYSTIFSTFDTANTIGFPVLFIEGSGVEYLGAFDYRTGQRLRQTALARAPLHPAFNAGSGYLVDVNYDFVNNAFGLFNVDPETGAYASLNITLLSASSISVGPCAVDPATQTWFGELLPQTLTANATFVQVDLAKGVVTRSLDLPQQLYDSVWVPDV
eukprot:TRINITY_DN5672_c0_g1_i1.p1 TRINITY_DN5672_c0_g1~~TRINITY_DN5672_c0_g1_i1.p1  ORF type:complete len:365 (+),score=69.70 TRINITY_DN5672_c0_g1_i1:37-1095(+)